MNRFLLSCQICSKKILKKYQIFGFSFVNRKKTTTALWRKCVFLSLRSARSVLKNKNIFKSQPLKNILKNTRFLTWYLYLYPDLYPDFVSELFRSENRTVLSSLLQLKLKKLPIINEYCTVKNICQSSALIWYRYIVSSRTFEPMIIILKFRIY